jgi:hypothetical protein
MATFKCMHNGCVKKSETRVGIVTHIRKTHRDLADVNITDLQKQQYFRRVRGSMPKKKNGPSNNGETKNNIQCTKCSNVYGSWRGFSIHLRKAHNLSVTNIHHHGKETTKDITPQPWHRSKNKPKRKYTKHKAQTNAIDITPKTTELQIPIILRIPIAVGQVIIGHSQL